VANLFAPAAGTSPVVYFAENFSGRVLGGRTPIVAYVAAVGFLVLFVGGLILFALGKSISVLVPSVAVAPALFFVGLMIIAKALWPTSEVAAVEVETAEDARLADENLRELSDLRRRLPAAISIVTTPIAGFDVGVAAGILSYILLTLLVPRKAESEGDPALIWLACFGVVYLFIKIKLVFG
jgi:xanthine/uracil/vitamin C permease (AzgA family)